MITPDEAMRQAHMTAHEYAAYGFKAYEDLTGMDRVSDPKATAMFVAGFMQAASTDFVGWAVQRRLEELCGTLDRITGDLVDLGASFREGR